MSRAWVEGGTFRRNVRALAVLALVIVAVGYGLVFAWLFLPLFVIAARISPGPAAG